MTKSEIQNAIKVMQAYLNGEQIESSNGYGWKDVTTPSFNFSSTQYRVKTLNKEDIALMENNDFSWALSQIKQGKKVQRHGWNGKGMFVFLVQGSQFKVNRPPLLGIYPEGTEINYHAHIDMKTADNMIVPWLASQTDILADDWEVVV